ncbi:MAG: peptide-methionine (S)-S-oxide reductase MsrA [Candidatus Thermoplasmatota archaeon]|jgi:peptide-methionine (S)-S-oxide reductase|nr:peptide-methionine (S)-S-oxide reductase MsrA [Candidatus Thermoplasmatota archaeon]MCL5786274.1 peptide-methionine (S)-S-oxide reductase MsrA [Candidatus Thermoplasmatota archaeon]
MTQTIVLGAGCFWCSEAVFSLVEGVESAVPGYAGGHTTDPTYEEVCTDRTGHAEVVKVQFDPEKIPLGDLLEIFFGMHDPTQGNRQGDDIGTQYRSVIYFTAPEQEATVKESVKETQGSYSKPLTTEVKQLGKFYPAEEYHMKYFARNPDRAYCKLVISPKVQKVRKKFGLEMKLQ